MNTKERVAGQRLVKFPQIGGAEAIEDATGTVVIYLLERNGYPVVMGFVGRRTKPDLRYRFGTTDEAREYGRDWLKKMEKDALEKQARKAFVHTLKVGDLLYTSWGWEQTNVDFYEVVALKGKTMAVLRERNTKVTGNGMELSMSGYTMPAPGFLRDELLTRRVGEGNTVTVKSYARGYPWDGKKKGTTWYG